MKAATLSSNATVSYEVSDHSYEQDGIRFLTIYSRSLGGRGDISVFSPSNGKGHSSLPVVLLLHGVRSSHWAWFFKGGAHHTVSHLIDIGRVRPMLLVAPSDGLYGEGSGYLAHSDRDFETWIMRDVLDVVRELPGTADDSELFVTGLSMGGYGALRLGAKYPDTFSGISAHSPITSIEELQKVISFPFPSQGINAGEADILEWVKSHREHLPPIRFDCGISDSLLLCARSLHESLTASLVPHRFYEFAGGHNWDYWRQHFEDSLLFFEEILSLKEATG